MATIPQDGDVIVTRENRSPVRFTIGQLPASAQFSVATRNEAIRIARTYARKHLVDIWYDQGEHHRLVETYRMGVTTGPWTS